MAMVQEDGAETSGNTEQRVEPDWLRGFIAITAGSKFSPDTRARLADFTKLITSFRDDTIERLGALCLSSDHQRRYYPVGVVRSLYSLFGRNSPWIEDNVVALLRIVPDDMKADSYVNYYIPIVRSFFTDDDGLQKDKLHEYDDDVISTLYARFRLTYQLSRFLTEEEERWDYDLPPHVKVLHDTVTYSKEFSGAPVLNSNLIRAAEKHQDRIHELVSIVIEHRTDDLETISELLSHPTALSRGAL